MHRKSVFRFATTAAGFGLVLGPATLVAGRAWAQGPSGSAPAGAGDAGALTGAAVIVLGLVLLGVIVAAIELLDLRRRRESEAVGLQAHVSDVLLQDSMLSGLPVTVTVRVPIRRGARAIAEVHGEVPSPELREAVLRLVERELSPRRSDVTIDDRLMVLPPVGTHAA